MTLTVTIRTVTPDEIRNKDAGDWRHLSDLTDESQSFQVLVKNVNNDWRYTFLVALHELIECALCRSRAISDATVTAFDKVATSQGIAEAGAMSEAPYHKEHSFATAIEMLMASELGITWGDYDKAIVEEAK